MTDTWDCQEARVALGVYVLGAIDPAERELVDAHLATCAACRAELAEFAGLPALLALVPAGEAIALADGLSADDLFAGGGFPGADFPGDDLFTGHSELAGADPGPLPPLPQSPLGDLVLPRLTQSPLADLVLPPLAKPPLARQAGPADAGQANLASVHDLAAARRRRQRAAWAGVAAAAVLIGGAFFGGTKLAAPAASQSSFAAQHPNGQTGGTWVTVRGSNGQHTATVAYQAMGWGIQMDALVTGIPVHTRCQMYVVETDGARVQVGGWETDTAEGTVWYPASTSVPVSDIREFVITLANGPQITVMPALPTRWVTERALGNTAGNTRGKPHAEGNVMVGLIVLVAVLLAATGVGLTLRWRQGKFKRSALVLTAEDLGAPLGERATLVQFSTEVCASCPPTWRMLGQVAAGQQGVTLVEVNAAARLDLARRLNVYATPTVLVLGPDGAVASRASGQPRKSDLLAAVGSVLDPGSVPDPGALDPGVRGAGA